MHEHPKTVQHNEVRYQGHLERNDSRTHHRMQATPGRAAPTARRAHDVLGRLLREPHAGRAGVFELSEVPEIRCAEHENAI